MAFARAKAARVGLARLALTLPSLLQLAATSTPDVYAVAGRYTSFVVVPPASEGRVLASGRNDYGQLGIQMGRDSPECSAQVVLPEGEGVQSVAVGGWHTLFLMSSGRIYGAGRNHKGQLGPAVSPVNGTVRLTLPDYLGSEPRVLQIAAGYAHSLFIIEHDSQPGLREVYGVGWNAQGQLAQGDTNDRTLFALMFQGGYDRRPIAIAAGHDFSFILSNNGKVYACGNNLGGQLGIGSRESRLRILNVDLDPAISHMFAGASHGVFVVPGPGATHELWASGSNFAGQLGNSTIASSATPVKTSAAPDLNLTTGGLPSAGGDSSCIRGELGETSFQCTGSNLFGQVGLGGQATSSTYQKVRVFGHETGEHCKVSVGPYHSLYFFQSPDNRPDELLATGANQYGQLGDCTRVSRTTFESSAGLTRTSTTATETITTYTGSTNTTTSMTETTNAAAPETFTTTVVTETITATAAATTTTVTGTETATLATTTATRQTNTDDDPLMMWAASGVVGAVALAVLFAVCRKRGQSTREASPEHAVEMGEVQG